MLLQLLNCRIGQQLTLLQQRKNIMLVGFLHLIFLTSIPFILPHAAECTSSRFISFLEDNGTFILSNCSRPDAESFDSPPYTCLPTGDTCRNITLDQIGNLTSDAVKSLKTSPPHVSALTVCCNSIKSLVALPFLIHILDFSNTPTLNVHQCHNLVANFTETNYFTLYNTEQLLITVKNRTETLDMRPSTDANIVGNRLDSEFTSRKITFLSTKTLELHAPLKAFSFIVVVDNTELSPTLLNAYIRSPFHSSNVNSDSAGIETIRQFMATPVYTDP